MFDIIVKSITVRNYRIVCLVQLISQSYSNPSIKDKLVKIIPSLKSHKCKNSNGKNFYDIMDSTSLAHILEHLIIDFQIKHANENNYLNKTLFGITQWINKSENIAKIEFSYYDDIIALQSLNEACNLLKSVVNN